MANNLKKFTTEAEYSAATLNYPAVSWVTVTDTVHFDKSAPAAFSDLTVYYNITDISEPTLLFNVGGSGSGSGSGDGSGGALPSAMIIDGTAVEVTNTYQFSDTGEHIVNYSFEDNTIPQMFLYDGEGIKFNTVTKIVIGDSITTISESKFGNGVFMQCKSLTSVTIGNSVTSIGSSAFNTCTSLTSVTLPNSVTSIGESAFESCTSLTSIDIPSGVTSIGESVFANCTSLSSIDIPSGVTSIGNGAFAGCYSLTSVTVNATTPPTLESYAFTSTNNCPIYVPSASVDAYKAASGWSDYASRIQAIA